LRRSKEFKTPFFASKPPKIKYKYNLVYEFPTNSAILINKNIEPNHVNIEKTIQEKNELINFFEEYIDTNNSKEFTKLISKLKKKFYKYCVTGKWILIYYT